MDGGCSVADCPPNPTDTPVRRVNQDAGNRSVPPLLDDWPVNAPRQDSVQVPIQTGHFSLTTNGRLPSTQSVHPRSRSHARQTTVLIAERPPTPGVLVDGFAIYVLAISLRFGGRHQVELGMASKRAGSTIPRTWDLLACQYPAPPPPPKTLVPGLVLCRYSLLRWFSMSKMPCLGREVRKQSGSALSHLPPTSHSATPPPLPPPPPP